MTENDPEITAMSLIATALEDLDASARTRILTWAAHRFEISEATVGLGLVAAQQHTTDLIEKRQYERFVDLFDAVSPKTDADRALVGAFWFQVLEEAADVAAQQVNDALKDVGHGVSNITDAFSTLQSRKPALVRQVAKSGKTRQARKRYKLTTAGVAAVEAMLRGTGDS